MVETTDHRSDDGLKSRNQVSATCPGNTIRVNSRLQKMSLFFRVCFHEVGQLFQGLGKSHFYNMIISKINCIVGQNKILNILPTPRN